MRVRSLCWLALLAATPAAAVDWPQPGLNAQHTGFNKKEKTISAANIGSLTQKWVASIPNGFSAAPVEVRGIVYVQSNDGTVYAVNATSGAVVWTYAAGSAVGNTGLTAGDKLVYTICKVPNDAAHGGICALNAATGALVWNFAIVTVQGQTVTDSYADNLPVLDHGLVFFGENFGGFGSPFSGDNVYALNAATGASVWGIAYNAGSGGTPFATDKGELFFQSGGSGAYVCAVKETDGSGMHCSAALTGDGRAAISIAGGKILAQSNAPSNTAFTALDETSLAPKWQTVLTYGTSNYSLYPPAVAGGLAYFYAGGNGDGSLFALSLKTGKQHWTYTCNGTTGCLNSGVSVANGVVFASCDRYNTPLGDQCAFDAKTGAQLRTYGSTDGNSGSEATPLVANGAEIGGCGAYSGGLCKFAP